MQLCSADNDRIFNQILSFLSWPPKYEFNLKNKQHEATPNEQSTRYQLKLFFF